MRISDHDRVAYIGEMTQQLAEMARTDGFDVLAYLLEMAKLEAEEAEAAIKRFQHGQRR